MPAYVPPAGLFVNHQSDDFGKTRRCYTVRNQQMQPPQYLLILIDPELVGVAVQDIGEVRTRVGFR
ncbi:MAG: hypothetical protein ACI87H_001203 [Gammaproteobacteria bacterium]|jgi:hypothetical protein